MTRANRKAPRRRAHATTMAEMTHCLVELWSPIARVITTNTTKFIVPAKSVTLTTTLNSFHGVTDRMVPVNTHTRAAKLSANTVVHIWHLYPPSHTNDPTR